MTCGFCGKTIEWSPKYEGYELPTQDINGYRWYCEGTTYQNNHQASIPAILAELNAMAEDLLK